MSEQQPSSEPRKVHVTSYGCQMNVYDAQKMVDVLVPEGYVQTSEVSEADLIILNTCHIRERATEKIYSELGKLKVLKQERAAQGKPTMITVAGCVAQAEGQEIIRRQPAVDIVVGPQTYHRLPNLIKRAKHERGVVETEFPEEDKFHHLPEVAPAQIRSRGVSAFVTIQEGCDKFCSFCVVPYTRGAEVSRPIEAILQDIRKLAQAGVREVTLLGQNVNAYHGVDSAGNTCSLSQLMRHIAQIEGIARIRYMTSHPCDMSDELIEAHREIPSVMPFLHLPVQSGSSRILEAMNRKHDTQHYLDWIDKIRAVRPDIALSSDFIVGFPGETEEDFLETMTLIEKVQFAACYSFKYSARPGTPGADLKDQVPEEIRKDRLARLQVVVDAQQKSFNAACEGRVMDVLFEKPGRYEGQVAGKSPYLQPVQVQGPLSLIGQVLPVRIVGLGSYSLFGELIHGSASHSE